MHRPRLFLSCSDRLDNLWRLGKVIHGFNEKVPGGGIDHTGAVNATRLQGNDRRPVYGLEALPESTIWTSAPRAYSYPVEDDKGRYHTY